MFDGISVLFGDNCPVLVLYLKILKVRQTSHEAKTSNRARGRAIGSWAKRHFVVGLDFSRCRAVTDLHEHRSTDLYDAGKANEKFFGLTILLSGLFLWSLWHWFDGNSALGKPSCSLKASDSVRAASRKEAKLIECASKSERIRVGMLYTRVHQPLFFSPVWPCSFTASLARLPSWSLQKARQRLTEEVHAEAG